jgi:hypothetical protein
VNAVARSTPFFHKLVEEHCPALAGQMAAQVAPLREFVRRGRKDYLDCGRLQGGLCVFVATSAALSSSWQSLGGDADLVSLQEVRDVAV